MTKNAAAIKLALAGNVLIFPAGFIVFLLLILMIPPLNNMYFIWLGMIVTALPLAALFVHLRRRFNSRFEPGMKRYEYVLICALPSFLFSYLIFWLMLLFDNGVDTGITTIIMAYAAPFSAVCILVISAALWGDWLLEKNGRENNS